jgi:hypothetical protein
LDLARVKTCILLIATAVLLAYLAGFVAVRSSFRDQGLVAKPDATGTRYLPSVPYANTEFFAPSTGPKRLWAYSLYYVYYPAGALDGCLSGRGYRITDQRDIIY